jgi:hypothetical protein
MKLILILVVGLVAVARAQTEADILQTLAVYEESQNTKNATLCALLFADDAVVNMPLGSDPAVGTDQIYEAFEGFFNEVVFMQEYLLGTPKINANYAGVAKMLFTQIGNCSVALEVVCMFTFNEQALITEFSAVWNTTDFASQASCTGATYAPPSGSSSSSGAEIIAFEWASLIGSFFAILLL